MSSAEFSEWVEYYKQEPFGDDWQQASTVAWAAAQPWSKKKLEPDSFIPRRYKPRQSREEITAKLSQFAKTHNAKVAARG
jgi:hypothetical protein